MLLLSDPQVEPAVSEARLLHPSGQGFFSIGQKLPLKPGQEKADWREKLYPAHALDRVALAARGVSDMYISQASFVRGRRRLCNTQLLRCAFTDLDVYKLGLPADDATLTAFLQASDRMGLPRPTYVVRSGQGFYMKWVFQDAISAQLLPQWNALQRMLLHMFGEFGSDAKCLDAARVLRLSQTVHSGNGETVRVVYESGQLHRFLDLCAIASKVELPAALATTRSKSRTLKARRAVLAEEPTDFGVLANFTDSRTPPMLRTNTLQSLNWCRFLDLRTLALARGGIHRGSRDMMLFWMTSFLAHAGIITPDNLWCEIEELLAGFPGAKDFDPLGDGQLTTLVERIKAQHRGEKVMHQGREYLPVYTPNNDTLLNILQITPEEERRLCTIISGEEKIRRADEKVPGRAERRAERTDCRAAAVAMKSQGVPVAQIAADLGKPLQTVYHWLRPDPRTGLSIIETRGRRSRPTEPGPGGATTSGAPDKREFSQSELDRRSRIHPGKAHLREYNRWTPERLREWTAARRARQEQLQACIEHSQRFDEQLQMARRAQSALATQVLLSSLREKSSQRNAGQAISLSHPASVSCNPETGPPQHE